MTVGSDANRVAGEKKGEHKVICMREDIHSLHPASRILARCAQESKSVLKFLNSRHPLWKKDEDIDSVSCGLGVHAVCVVHKMRIEKQDDEGKD